MSHAFDDQGQRARFFCGLLGAKGTQAELVYLDRVFSRPPAARWIHCSRMPKGSR